MTGQQINPRNCGICGNREYHIMGLVRCKINKELVQKGDPQYEWSCILGCGSCINEGEEWTQMDSIILLNAMGVQGISMSEFERMKKEMIQLRNTASVQDPMATPQPQHYRISEEQVKDLLATIIGISRVEPFDPNDMKVYPIPDGEKILKEVMRHPTTDVEKALKGFRDWWNWYCEEYKRNPDTGDVMLSLLSLLTFPDDWIALHHNQGKRVGTS